VSLVEQQVHQGNVMEAHVMFFSGVEERLHDTTMETHTITRTVHKQHGAVTKHDVWSASLFSLDCSSSFSSRSSGNFSDATM